MNDEAKHAAAQIFWRSTPLNRAHKAAQPQITQEAAKLDSSNRFDQPMGEALLHDRFSLVGPSPGDKQLIASPEAAASIHRGIRDLETGRNLCAPFMK